MRYILRDLLYWGYKMIIKNKIVEWCSLIAQNENRTCEVYFNETGTTKYKVTIKYGGDLYRFRTYKDALYFLQH